MINVSNEFKENTKKIHQHDIQLEIVDNESANTTKIKMMRSQVFNIIPNAILKSKNQIATKEVVYSFEGQLFKTIMRQLELTVKNASEIKDKEINFKYGISIDDDFEYVDLGNFYIKDIEDSKRKSEMTVTGYDRMLRFMITFKQEDLKLTYPCTLLQLVQRICEVCRVELYSTDFFNADLIIDTDFFTIQDITYRDVLEKVTQATLTTAFIKENKLYFCKILNTSVQQLDQSYISDLIIKEKLSPVNALVLGRGDVEDNLETVDNNSININGRCEIRFDENELIEYQREKVIDAMFEQIKGLEYYSFEASDLGVMWLEPCDCIELGDREENFYKSYYLKANITITTGIASDIEAELLEETNTQYKVTNKEEKRTLKVERLAKKHEGLIQDIIEEQTDFSEKITNHEQTINSISNEVRSLYNFSKTVSGTNELFLEDALPTNILKFEADAENTRGIYPSKKLFPSLRLFPKKGGTTVTLVVGRTSRAVDPTPILPSLKLFPGKRLFPRANGYYKQEYEFYLSRPLRKYKNISDKFVVEVDEEKGTCVAKIIRYIKYNDDGTIKINSEPEIEVLDELQIQLYKGNNYIYLKEYRNWNIQATYIFNNELNKQYAPRVETNSLMKLLKDSILLQVSEKAGKDELIALINLTPGQIRMEGYTSINGGFAIDQEGNASIANGTVNINKEGIQLADGAKVVGGEGVIGNLQFTSNGAYKGFDLLGYAADFFGASDQIQYAYGDVSVEVYIPENFTITSAYVILQHTPVLWEGYDPSLAQDYSVWGYPRNVKLYKATGNENYQFNLSYLSSFNVFTNNISVEEIKNVFGTNGYTPTNHSGSNYETKISTDISNQLSKGYQRLIIRSADAIPSNIKGCATKTGVAKASVVVIGFVSNK